MAVERRKFENQTYIYVTGKAPMLDGAAIAKAMGDAFGQAFGFIQQAGITPLSAPISVYTKMPGAKVKFRCGFFVSPEDAKKAEGDISAGQISAGDALHSLHTGPYAELNKTHGAIWGYAKANGLSSSMPVWEIYIDDPETTPPEKLRTEVYHSIKGS